MEQYKIIETKFLPATDNHGSRVKAYDANKNQITIGYPHELSGVECHREAAQALCNKMGWKGKLLGGWSSKGCAFLLKLSF